MIMISLILTHLQMTRILVMILKCNQHLNAVSIIIIIIVIIISIMIIIISDVHSNNKTSSSDATNNETQSTSEQGEYIIIN